MNGIPGVSLRMRLQRKKLGFQPPLLEILSKKDNIDFINALLMENDLLYK